MWFLQQNPRWCLFPFGRRQEVEDLILLLKRLELFRRRLHQRMDVFEKPDKAGRHNHHQDLAARGPDIPEGMRHVFREKGHTPSWGTEPLLPQLEFHLALLHIEEFILV